MTASVPWSNKADHRHWDRLAVVYVRQSSMQQLVRNQESTLLQYGLVDRAVALGWPRDRVVVIDDDLGLSGATAQGRPGFQRLVADVSLDRVGLVLGIEMSRLARSCRDWYQLLEVCSVFGTLIADLDGVYDPSQYNDRLLLGLKGTMSEAELHVIKQRMHSGRLNKLQRGEYEMSVPSGYLRRPSGDVVKEPDEQAQATVAMVFEVFERVRTADGVLRYLADNGIRLPIRSRTGANKGELEWRRPIRETLVTMLKNPAYAGAYVWGRFRTDPRHKIAGRPKTGQRVVKPGQWEVCLRDRLPAYITWEQYERNLKQFALNMPQHQGPVRKGAGLLCGLLRCGRCGQKMSVRYAAGARHHYECMRARVSYREPRCQSLNGNQLDLFVSRLALQALEPAALEVSLSVAASMSAQRNDVQAHWLKRLERARYESERAFRQYNAVEPENRLVARGLEKQWEQSLLEQKNLEDEFVRHQAQEPTTLTTAERDAILALSSDLPSLWSAETTTPQDRQTILRHLIETVAVTVHGDSELVDVTVSWKGGNQTCGQFARPVSKITQLSTYQQLLDRTAELSKSGHDLKSIAATLNQEGFRPPRRSQEFTVSSAHSLLQHHRLSHCAPRTAEMVANNDWPLMALAQELDIPKPTLFRWAQRGLVEARRTQARGGMAWLIRADDSEVQRLREARKMPGSSSVATR